MTTALTTTSREATAAGATRAPGAPADERRRATTRRPGLDALRIAGLLAVVASHDFGDSVWSRNAFFPWHVPVFFVLSGLLWNTRRDLAGEWRNRWTTLLFPYVAWMLIVGAFPLAQGLLTGDPDTGETLHQMLVGGQEATRPFTAFWFATTLAASALLLRLLERNLALAWAVALVWTAGVALAPHWFAHVPLSLGIAGPGLLLMLVGRALPTLQRSRSALVAVGLAAVVLWTATQLAVLAPVDLKQGDLGTPVLGLLTSATVSITLVVLAARLRLPRTGSAISHVAQAGIVVIFTHNLFFMWLSTPSAGSWRDYVIAVVGSFGLGLLALRHAPALAGAPAGRGSGASGPHGGRGATSSREPHGGRGAASARVPHGGRGATSAGGPHGGRGATGASGPHGGRGATSASEEPRDPRTHPEWVGVGPRL